MSTFPHIRRLIGATTVAFAITAPAAFGQSAPPNLPGYPPVQEPPPADHVQVGTPAPPPGEESPTIDAPSSQAETAPSTAAPAPTNPRPACTITGTPRGETLRGTPGRDVVCAGGGHDTIVGRGGNDVLRGGRGTDDLDGGRGRDRLEGGGGNDTLRSRGRGQDLLVGGAGRDLVLGDAADRAIGTERGNPAPLAHTAAVTNVDYVGCYYRSAYTGNLQLTAAGEDSNEAFTRSDYVYSWRAELGRWVVVANSDWTAPVWLGTPSPYFAPGNAIAGGHWTLGPGYYHFETWIYRYAQQRYERVGRLHSGDPTDQFLGHIYFDTNSNSCYTP